MKRFGVQMIVFGRNGRLETQNRWFATEGARERAVNRVQEAGRLYRVLGWCDEP